MMLLVIHLVLAVFSEAKEAGNISSAIHERKFEYLYKNTDFYPHVRHSENKRYRLKDNFLDKDIGLSYCPRPAKCESLVFTSCMGSKLPYYSTTLELTDLSSQTEVQEKLQIYQYLRFIPKCWSVIQPFLCALYMPKCENNSVDLPSKEMCKITMGPCKILYNTTIFPEFMRCEDERLFPSQCKNDIHELKFNTTSLCMNPLVKTDQEKWFYRDVEGCGLRCKDNYYTETEQSQIHKLVAYCVLLCLLLNVFTIITFVIDWKTANKYPALAIFYINICFLVSYVGWLVQFLGYDTREDIVCKKDGTLRVSEPSATENLSCVVVFVMVYYFLIAGMVWFVIFTYSWHMSSLQALGKIQDRVDKKKAYFHLVAWSLPLILTITTMALGQIDGNYVTGICFVGFVNYSARLGLLLTPIAAVMAVAGFIIVRGLILLIRVKIESRNIISEHSSRKIGSNIMRMSVFAIFMLVFCIITFVYHNYQYVHSEIWENSLHNFILCKLTSLSSDYSHCRQENRPSVAMLQLQLLAVFGVGVAMASWVWCEATLHSWTRYIRRKFQCEVEEPLRLQKHRIIAEAFAKRKYFHEGGRISIECVAHSDPVGLEFDLNSAGCASRLSRLSTTWAANLPRLVTRRGAVPNCRLALSDDGAATGTNNDVNLVTTGEGSMASDMCINPEEGEEAVNYRSSRRHHNKRNDSYHHQSHNKYNRQHHRHRQNNHRHHHNHRSRHSLNASIGRGIGRKGNGGGSGKDGAGIITTECDSEVSYSVRHVSIESRRNSGDSALSVQIAEWKATARTHARHKHGKCNCCSSTQRTDSRPMRRSSSTSLDSLHFDNHQQLLSAMLSASRTGALNQLDTATAARISAPVARKLILSNTSTTVDKSDPLHSVVASGLDGSKSASHRKKKHKIDTNNAIDEMMIEKHPVLPNLGRRDASAGLPIHFNQNSDSDSEHGSMIMEKEMDLNDKLMMDSLRKANVYKNKMYNNETGSSSNDNSKDSVASDLESNGSSKKDNIPEKKLSQQHYKRRDSADSFSSALTTPHNGVTEDICNSTSSSSACHELQRLAVQSSMNSAGSGSLLLLQQQCMTRQQQQHSNRGSKQSKTSIDVAVQANAKDILNQTQHNSGNNDSMAITNDNCQNKQSMSPTSFTSDNDRIETSGSKSKKTKTKENKQYKKKNNTDKIHNSLCRDKLSKKEHGKTYEKERLLNGII